MNRIYKFDTIKVICMMMVVLVHTLINSYGSVQQEMIRFPLLCYTMPMFTFISGYFSKPIQNLKKKVKQLLIPCIIFTLINDGIQILVNPEYHLSLVTPGFAMWYLWALFIYRTILPYVHKMPYIVIISFIFSWVAGFYNGINATLSMSRIICFFPYFLLGYKVAHDSKYTKLQQYILGTNWISTVLLLIIFAVWEIFIYTHPGHTIATGFNSGYGVSKFGIVLRILLQVTIIVTGYLFIRIIPNRPLSITKYGSRTMNVYLLHATVVLPFAYKVFPPLVDASIIVAVCMILVPTSICLIFFTNKIDTLIKYVFRQSNGSSADITPEAK